MRRRQAVFDSLRAFTEHHSTATFSEDVLLRLSREGSHRTDFKKYFYSVLAESGTTFQSHRRTQSHASSSSTSTSSALAPSSPSPKAKVCVSEGVSACTGDVDSNFLASEGLVFKRVSVSFLSNACFHFHLKATSRQIDCFISCCHDARRETVKSFSVE